MSLQLKKNALGLSKETQRTVTVSIYNSAVIGGSTAVPDAVLYDFSDLNTALATIAPSKTVVVDNLLVDNKYFLENPMGGRVFIYNEEYLNSIEKFNFLDETINCWRHGKTFKINTDVPESFTLEIETDNN